MPTIQCTCGNRFSGESWSHDGTVYCPRCGQALAPVNQTSGAMTGAVPPVVHGGQPIASTSMPGPQPSNQAAIVGFILSLLSLFGCLILAPVSLFVSLRGLKMENERGLAIAGIVIGSIQSVVLLGVVAYFAVVAIAVGGLFAAMATITGDAMVEFDRMLSTETALDEAERRIVQYSNAEGEWPEQEVGNAIVGEIVDGWGNAVFFEKDHESWWVASAGNDGIPGTFDDVERRRPANDFLDSDGPEDPLPVFPSPSSEADTIESVEEALQRTASSKPSDVLLGLRWLRENDPVPLQRKHVVESMLALCQQPHARRQAVEVIQKWVYETEMQAVQDHLQKLEGGGSSVEDRELVRILGEAESSHGLLGLVNHPLADLRLEARRLLQQREGIHGEWVDQSVADLQKNDRCEYAMQWLERAEVIAEKKNVICRAVNPLVKADDFRQRRAALQVLRRWGPLPVNIDALADVGALDLLVTIHDKRVLEKLGEMLERWPVDFQKAAAEMRRIGPASETYIWPMIANSNHVIASQALQLLGDVGSEKSIAQIEPLLEQPLLRSQARNCIQRIQQAQRDPEEW